MLYYNVTDKSFGQLGVLGKQINTCANDVAQLKVAFLRPYCVAYLDQRMWLASKNKSLKFESTYPKVNQYLKQSRFSHLLTQASCQDSFPQEDIIALVRFHGSSLEIENSVVQWITKDVLQFLPQLDKKLRKKIVENLWEIVHNGILHGEGEFGVSACGQFYPMMGYVEIAFYDSGFGIPTKVKQYQALSATASDSECIAWAIEKGHSTRPLNESSGLGLHLLREFLTLNGGIFQIASGTGYFCQNAHSESFFTTLRNSIAGTLVNIRVVFDNNLYSLTSKSQ